MKFSESWLREWVSPTLDTEALCHQITMAGLEVDAVEPVAGAFSNVVVGKVLKVEPHPDADKLRVCSVDVGKGEPLTIVCGAANVAEGMHVPTALVGAELPGGMKIKQAKLRGVPSFGMLCSAAELGLAESASGLLPLPTDLKPGTDVREALQLDDVSIELGLTPNRGDCLSVAGVAREVGVLNSLPVTAPVIEPVKAVSDDTLPVVLEAAADCPRYCGRVIRNVNVSAETPLWMQERLRRSGLRSLGPVVDVTNYVLLELGQPMHAFDLAKLSGAICVRHARDKESITLLDGQTIELNAGTLVIADDSGPQALAGIMGGNDSAVGDDTRDIFLESAFFSPLAVAGRARSYGLHTDSSHRFERGVDPAGQHRAIERATALLLAIVGGEPGPVIDLCSDKDMPSRQPVRLRRARLASLLGTAVADVDIENILTRLGMQVVAADDGWTVTPPSFRFDMELEVDLIEEVGRIHGYDNLPVTPLQAPLAIFAPGEARVSVNRLKALLVDRGYQEAITYSFVDESLQAVLDPGQTVVRLANPISADMAVMRTSLWPGLAAAARHNLARQQERVRLFETGLRFRTGADGKLQQEPMLAGLITGLCVPRQWDMAKRAVDFYDLKGDVEALLARCGGEGEFTYKSEGHAGLHPGQCARIYKNDKAIGWLGKIHPEAAKKADLGPSLYLFELELAAIMHGNVPKFEQLSKFPAIRRDLALVVDETVSFAEIRRYVQKSASSALKKFQCFDVYRGEGIDSGRKSLAVGLTFQDLTRTLNDDDVNADITKILATLAEQLGATLRS